MVDTRRPRSWGLEQLYRRPYCIRHFSVNWNAMIGKKPLLVAHKHGHSLVTMWRTYAAWMDGALESDIGLVGDGKLMLIHGGRSGRESHG